MGACMFASVHKCLCSTAYGKPRRFGTQLARAAEKPRQELGAAPRRRYRARPRSGRPETPPLVRPGFSAGSLPAITDGFCRRRQMRRRARTRSAWWAAPDAARCRQIEFRRRIGTPP